VNEFNIALLLFQADIFDRASPLLLLFIRNFFKKGYLGNEKKITITNERNYSSVIARSENSLACHCEPPGGEAIPYEKVEIATSLRSSQ
jgi:hypothetical protein